MNRTLPAPTDYLVSHGKSGGFGRFSAAQPTFLDRGDRVVVASPRGLELGGVLCQATPQHARLLPQPSGQILRIASAVDEQLARRLDQLAQQIFADGRCLAADLDLPVEIMDVEVLLDGRNVLIQHLSPQDWDFAPFVEELERRHNLVVLMESLAAETTSKETEEEHGCGKPDCGKVGGGGCSSCGTGGGGCSSCGSGKVDMKAYFGHLRTRMDERQRVPLL